MDFFFLVYFLLAACLGETLGFALRLTEENKAEVTEKEEERMRKNQIGTLFIVSALALSGVGMSYAMWSETIVMQGSVTAGSLDFGWSLGDSYDSEPVEKDLASEITATLSEDENTMTVTITNAYPCITYTQEFDVHCIGNVPVHFQGFYLVEEYARQWLVDGIITIGPQVGQPEIYDVQLHQGDIWLGLLTFHFDNDDGFLQDTLYTFTVELFGYQYNEPCEGYFPGKTLDLPPGVIANGIKLKNGNYWPGNEGFGSTLYTYFDLTLQNIPVGYDVYSDDWPGFCADTGVYIYTETNYNVELLDSRDPMLPGYATDDEQWDMVNFLLNHYDDVAPGADWRTLQAAVWHYTDAAPGGDFESYKNVDLADYNAIVAYVNANGAGFNPGAGDWLAVVCIINSGVQLSFIVVDP